MSALRLALAGALALGTIALFWPVTGFGFVHFDDPRYVAANPALAEGLTWESARWAFRTFHLSNWHPLTWLSLALDVSLFGVDPGALHAINLALHTLNALLVFALLVRATGSHWASFAVAALFAWHPLHVEPVAWISERKELLAAGFGLAACHAWLAFARRGGAARQAAVAAWMALSLLAKPMWVTLPLLLLALDHWPLGRLAPRPARRALEKLPLLVLSAASAAVTLAAQGPALETGAEAPLAGRLANALVSPVLYLGKALWPAGLSVIYPHPYLPGGEPFAAWQVAGAAALLAALAALAWRLRERRYLAAGLAWYAIALVPVIGLVQVGVQGMADRYTYVPLLGVFWAVCFGARDAVEAGRRRAPWLGWAVPALFVVALGACAWRSADQLGAWRDSFALYERSLAAAPTSPALHYNHANRLLEAGREAEALGHYERARALHPAWAEPTLNLAWLLATTADPARADPERALALAREASDALGGADPNALDTLAAAYAAAGDFERAEQTARRAVERARARGLAGPARVYESRRRLFAEGRRYVERRVPERED